jgi:hypothetical protein
VAAGLERGVTVAELRLEAFLPADDVTATALAKLTGTAG